MKVQVKFGFRELSVASLGLSESIMCRQRDLQVWRKFDISLDSFWPFLSLLTYASATEAQ